MTPRKVLIVYATGYGSTAEVAEVMAEELRSLDVDVEVQSADTARAPEENEAVVIGSVIRYDRWLPAAFHYLNRHQEILGKIPVAYFYTCLALAAPSSPSTDQPQIYDSKLLGMNPCIKPIMIGGFAGVLNYRPMPWYFRLVLGVIAKVKGLPAGDYRNWEAIRNWIRQFTNCI